jgi:hypothetical protein
MMAHPLALQLRNLQAGFNTDYNGAPAART